MSNELPQANWKERILYLLGRRQAYLVDGESMAPTIKTGTIVLIDRRSEIGLGDIVLAKHPYRSSVKILKRVSKYELGGDLILCGDNTSESTDSRTFGAVSIESIIGRVVCQLK